MEQGSQHVFLDEPAIADFPFYALKTNCCSAVTRSTSEKNPKNRRYSSVSKSRAISLPIGDQNSQKIVHAIQCTEEAEKKLTFG